MKTLNSRKSDISTKLPKRPNKRNNVAAFFAGRGGTIFFLILLIGAAVAISFLVMMRESLRLDEAQSIWQTSHSLSRTLEIVAQDVHMPLYHILLHYWMVVFGSGVEAVRSMSLIFFLASIPVLYLLARTLLSRNWSLVLIGLFVLSPFMSWYGSETRMYTLLTFFALLSQYFFTRILQGKQGWGGYAITAILGAFSHYFFFFTLAAQGIYYLVNRNKFAPGTFKRLVLVAIGIIVAISPWIYYFISQGAANNTRPQLPVPSTVDFFNVFSQFFFGFQTDAINTIILSSWPLLVIVAFFTVKRRMKIDKIVMYMLTAGLLPIALAFAVSFVITPFFLGRYMMPAVAPLYIVAVWLISQYSKKTAAVIIGLWVVTVSSMFILQMTSTMNPMREDFKEAASYIEKNADISDAIVLTSPFTVYPFEYYYDGHNQIRTLPLWNRQDEGGIPPFSSEKLSDEVEQLKKGHDHIYILASQDQGYEEEVLTYFRNRFELTHKEQYSEDMTLYVYKVGYKPRPFIGANN